MKKYHKWTPADDHYLRDNRENTSLEELASHLKVSEIAVERRLSRLKIYVGKSWRPPGKKMGRPAKL
jgi:Zn-dependent peptidase ImmA (M78 family)